ncbi:MAG: toll/interleukin-1 receptor domain-containing protein [Anaerolineae bacterium]|nr:toll/interleukin-1 receptor domain-containing protein [Anaerolineae bacterium]
MAISPFIPFGIGAFLFILLLWDFLRISPLTPRKIIRIILTRLGLAVFGYILGYFVLFRADPIMSAASGIVGFILAGIFVSRLRSAPVIDLPTKSSGNRITASTSVTRIPADATTVPQLSVFISYRRNTSKFIARAIFEDLRRSGYNVFMDVESIDSGDFERIILNQIAARAHFVVILTQGAVERFVDPQDWFRREIERAISLERNIVPILVEDFRFEGAEKYLVGPLKRLSTYNALTLHHEYFEEAMERLRSRFLKTPVYAKITPTPAGDQATVGRKIAEIANRPQPTRAEINAESYLEAGNRTFAHGDYAAAIESYNQAIRMNPQYALAHYNRGMSHKELGQPKEAFTDFSRTIQLDPQFARAYFQRARLLQGANRLDRAIEDYRQYLKLDGGSEYGDSTEVEAAVQKLVQQMRSSSS